MLEKADLDRKLDKAQYKKQIDKLERQLGELQRKARSLGIPVTFVFEGWDAAGKGTLINRMILALDPRGYTVHPTNPPTEDERLHPFLWRFWTKTPPAGRIAIFDRSWYGRVLVERIDKLVKKKVWQSAYDDINAFERQLADDGNIIIKFFLHISKKEQKKRFRKLRKNSATAWKVTDEDMKHHRQYDKYLEAYEDMFSKTNKPYAHWTVIESEDHRYATIKIFKTAIRVIGKRVALLEKGEQPRPRKIRLKPMKQSPLDQVDLNVALTREEYSDQLKKCQRRIRDIEHEIYSRRIPIMILYEGWDAAGKGGNIRRLVANMDPRGYEVAPVAAPNDVEKAHHYLWRFWNNIPKAGHITIFDRTWYGRVLVERIEGFCSEQEWQRAFEEIREMERQFTNANGVIAKFWLHISKEEQLRRFKAREKTPYKRWKITDEDWRNREKWDAYKVAVDEMIDRTSTPNAPWTIVEGNCKWYARIKCLKTVINAAESKL